MKDLEQLEKKNQINFAKQSVNKRKVLSVSPPSTSEKKGVNYEDKIR